MTGKQILNRNSYIVIGGIVLLIAAYFVAQSGSLLSWLAWIAIVAALATGLWLLRPGKGTPMSEAELEKAISSGVPLMLQLFSNY